MTSVTLTPAAPAPRVVRRAGGRARGLAFTAAATASGLALLALIWEGAKAVVPLPDAVLPHLSAVGAYLVTPNTLGQLPAMVLLASLAVTLAEALAGLAVGTVIGLVIGTASGKWVGFGRSVGPVLVLSQTLPIVAIAPAIVIFVGRNWMSMAALAAILTFFPIAVSVTTHVRAVTADDRELFASFGASPRRVFWSLEVPQALFGAGAAMRTAAALALVGALVAELPSGVQSGIAAFLLSASSHYAAQPAALWAAALLTMAGGVLLSAAANTGFALLTRSVLRTRRIPGETS